MAERSATPILFPPSHGLAPAPRDLWTSHRKLAIRELRGIRARAGTISKPLRLRPRQCRRPRSAPRLDHLTRARRQHLKSSAHAAARPPTSLTICPLRPPLLRRSAADDELQHLCARWLIEYRAPTAGENSTAHKKRHKQLNDLWQRRRREHLATLQEHGRARVADSHFDPALAGRVCFVLGEHRVGNAVLGLNVRVGSVVEPVDAHLLALPSGGEIWPEPTPTPPPASGASTNVSTSGASTNVSMNVTPPPRGSRGPPRHDPVTGRLTHTPGLGPGGADESPWLIKAWDRAWPNCNPPAPWEATGARPAESPGGHIHPPGCDCARRTCPFLGERKDGELEREREDWELEREREDRERERERGRADRERERERALEDRERAFKREREDRERQRLRDRERSDDTMVATPARESAHHEFVHTTSSARQVSGMSTLEAIDAAEAQGKFVLGVL